MAVGGTGLGATQPPLPPPVNTRGNQGAGNRSANVTANARANSPASASNALPPPTVFVPANPGGTTSPSRGGLVAAQAGARGLAQAGAPPPAAMAGNALAALMNNPQGAAFLASAKISSETKQKRGVGNAKEDSGDVQVETEAEAKGAQALKDTSTETGQGDDLSAATNAGSVAT